MLLYFASRVISATVAFLYPGYASYKTLSQRPASEEELERWLMYWSVLGCIVSLEYVAEWLVSWLPFYYPLKTAFLLYLALPQTAGATYLFRTHLRPFFAAHEPQIDSTLAQLKGALYASLQRVLRAAWAHVSTTLRQMNGPAGVGAEAPLAEDAAANTGPPPTLGDPVSGPAQLVQGLWRNYGPGILTSGAALLRQMQNSAAQAQAGAQAGPGAEGVRPYDLSDSSPSTPTPTPAPSVPMPAADSPAHKSSSASSSSSSVRQRAESGTGRSTFEEVEVPSDAEGEGVGHPVAEKPAQARRTSWFGWGASANSNPNPGKGYERVKSD